MCGIFAYKGKLKADLPVLLSKGLGRLDYRGHDSFGISYAAKGRLIIRKKTGEISNVFKHFTKSDLKSASGIAHTRWATHGKVTKTNAHPHISKNNDFALVHNGIVENFDKLKLMLQKKMYKFKTQTDTEVIVSLIEQELDKDPNYVNAIIKVSKKIKGRNTFVIINKKGEIFGYKNGSPLVLGIDNKEKSYFLSSDTLSFSNVTNLVITLKDGEIIHIGNTYKFFDTYSGKTLDRKAKHVDVSSGEIEKEGFAHFMLKEIFDNPYVIGQTIKTEKNKLVKASKLIKKSRKVFVLGSGTSGVAASQIAYYLRTISKVDALSLIGAEVVSYYQLFTKEDLIIVLSQSGETADVLEVLEFVKQKNIKIISFINMSASSIENLSSMNFAANAGPEVCVLSTKVFVSQLVWGYLLAKTVAGNYKNALYHLNKLKKETTGFLKNNNNLKVLENWATDLIKKRNIFILGKSENLAISEEAMIKIIEGSYIHAHAIPAGDLKHYAITIIEKGVPVILIVSDNLYYKDIVSAASQVKARGATVYGVGQKENNIFDHFLKVPSIKEAGEILNIVPFQLLSYYMAVHLGNNVDKPRNIAKSVTVK